MEIVYNSNSKWWQAVCVYSHNLCRHILLDKKCNTEKTFLPGISVLHSVVKMCDGVEVCEFFL